VHKSLATLDKYNDRCVDEIRRLTGENDELKKEMCNVALDLEESQEQLSKCNDKFRTMLSYIDQLEKKSGGKKTRKKKANEEGGFSSKQQKSRALQKIQKCIIETCGVQCKSKIHSIIDGLAETNNYEVESDSLAEDLVSAFKGRVDILRKYSPQTELVRHMQKVMIWALAPSTAMTHISTALYAKTIGYFDTSPLFNFAVLKAKKVDTWWRTVSSNPQIPLPVASGDIEYTDTPEQRKALQTFKDHIKDDLSEYLGMQSRVKRKDALTVAQITQIHQSYEECCECSPKPGDEAHLRTGPKSRQSHQKYYKYVTNMEIRNYCETNYHLKVSEGTISEHRPYWVYDGIANTCMCHMCVDMKGYKLAVKSNPTKFNAPVVKPLALYALKRLLMIWLIHWRCGIPMTNKRGITFVKKDIDPAMIGVREIWMKVSKISLVIKIAEKRKISPMFLSLNTFIISCAHWLRSSKTKCAEKTRFPYRFTIVKMCQSEYKSSMVEEVVCACALPHGINSETGIHTGMKDCYFLDDNLCVACHSRPACRTMNTRNKVEYTCGEDGLTNVCMCCVGHQETILNRLYLIGTKEDEEWVKRVFVKSIYTSTDEGEEVDTPTGFLMEDHTWDNDTLVNYNSWQDAEGKNTAEYHCHTAPIKTFLRLFLTHFQGTYIKHVAILRHQRLVAKQEEQNMLPNMLKLDIDFAENGTYGGSKEVIQSAHWSNKTYTLFMCIAT
jgi:hypothetical protein